METIGALVDGVLDDFAAEAELPADSDMDVVVGDSLDKIRLLVAIEERLGTTIDDAEFFSLDFGSRATFVAGFVRMLSTTGEETTEGRTDR